MMDPALAQIVLLVVSSSLVLNLFLTLRLAASARLNHDNPPFHVVLGEVLPSFEGKAFFDGRLVISGDMYGQAAVIIFLSAGCHKCLAKIPELCQLNASLSLAGIPLWIVALDSARGLARHLKGSGLIQNLLELAPFTRRSLNPNNASPFYILIDHEGIARARNAVGDENWQFFVEQVKDHRAMLEAVP